MHPIGADWPRLNCDPPEAVVWMPPLAESVENDLNVVMATAMYKTNVEDH